MSTPESGDSATPSSLSLQLIEAVSARQLPHPEVFQRALTTMRVPAGQVLFSEGDRHPYGYFVVRGVVKLSAPNPHKGESLVGIAKAGDITGSLAAQLPESYAGLLSADLVKMASDPGGALGRADVTARTLTTAELERVDMRIVMRLAARHAPWAMVLFRTSALHALSQERRSRALQMLNPEERYRQFVRNFPELIGVLPQKDIAAYLGVTPEGLSRIATRIRREDA